MPNPVPSTAHSPYPPALWRLLIHDPANGAYNMAVDEAISEAVRAGQVPPTLRFYAWEPDCLSLGYGQPSADADFNRLRANGWGIVRRLTGGRAILHADELTYSVAAPLSDPRVQGSIVESYRRLSMGLLAGLNALGAAAAAEQADADAHRFKGAVCFEVPSDYEITAHGRKLVGSAQTRRGAGDVVMQHGALPLAGDVARICEALAFETPAARQAARARVLERAITLEEALGRPVSFAQAADALTQGFAGALSLTFEPGELTPAESERAAALYEERYSSPAWTLKL